MCLTLRCGLTFFRCEILRSRLPQKQTQQHPNHTRASLHHRDKRVGSTQKKKSTLYTINLATGVRTYIHRWSGGARSRSIKHVREPNLEHPVRIVVFFIILLFLLLLRSAWVPPQPSLGLLGALKLHSEPLWCERAWVGAQSERSAPLLHSGGSTSSSCRGAEEAFPLSASRKPCRNKILM